MTRGLDLQLRHTYLFLGDPAVMRAGLRHGHEHHLGPSGSDVRRREQLLQEESEEEFRI